MSDERAQLEAELAEIEQALAAPEALPAATRQAILDALRHRH
jgi:DNA-binding transcriptional ArsR family regulator